MASQYHRTTPVCNPRHVAMVLNRRLRRDPAKEEFIGDDRANRLLRNGKPGTRYAGYSAGD